MICSTVRCTISSTVLCCTCGTSWIISLIWTSGISMISICSDTVGISTMFCLTSPPTTCWERCTPT